MLNFGHTIGHAIEVGSDFQLLHGEAVALGLMAEIEWAEAEGFSSQLSAPIASALTALEQNCDWRGAPIAIDTIGADKKRRGNQLRIPYAPKLGRFEIRSVPVTALVEFVRNRRT